MQIETNERYSGIPFNDSKQAFNALVLWLADFHEHAEWTGPDIFEKAPDLFGFEFMRINGFLERFKENGQASAEYGDHIGSVFSNMYLGVINRKSGGSNLYLTPYLSSPANYEDRVIELLNDEATKQKLKPYFGDKKYSRILDGAYMNFSGSEEEIKNLISILKNDMKLGCMPFDSFGKERHHFDGDKEYQLPLSEKTGENALLNVKKYKVYITGSDDSRGCLDLSFSHPKSHDHEFYDGQHLIHARDTFRKDLEALLAKKAI